MTLIINAGVSGQSIAEMEGRLDLDCLVHRPDLMILLAGTNDCCNSQKLLTPTGLPLAYTRLAERILPVSRLMLVTPLAVHIPSLLTRHDPAAFGGVPAVERLEHARQALLSLANSYQLPLVDLWAISNGAGLVGDDPRCWLRNQANAGVADGVHPTADGYRAIAAAIGAVVLNLRPRPQRIVCLGDSITFGSGVPGEGGVTGENWPGWLRRMLDS